MFINNYGFNNYKPKFRIVAGFIVFAVIVALVLYFSTANGKRALKDLKSNFSFGLEREITILDMNNNVIFHYEGKVDIETNHEGNANYILFEGEDGKRHIIYYSQLDTVLIIEK